MKAIVESLKRLYANGKITEQKITSMYQNSTITIEEYNYILKEGGNDVHNTD